MIHFHGQELLGRHARGVGLDIGHLVAHEAVAGLAPLEEVAGIDGGVAIRLRNAVGVGSVDEEGGSSAVAQLLVGGDGAGRIVRISQEGVVARRRHGAAQIVGVVEEERRRGLRGRDR